MPANRWTPANYLKWRPNPKQMLRFQILELGITTKSDKPPCFVTTMRAASWPDGKHLWRGKTYKPFGYSDYWDDKTGELIEFYHSVLSIRLIDYPDWEAISNRINLHDFIGRLETNGDFFNLLSIQRVSLECDWNQSLNSEPMNAWTGDGLVFSCDYYNSPRLIPEEDFERSIFGTGKRGDWDRFVDEQAFKKRDEAVFVKEPTLNDFEDDPPAQCSKTTPNEKRNTKRVIDADELA